MAVHFYIIRVEWLQRFFLMYMCITLVVLNTNTGCSKAIICTILCTIYHSFFASFSNYSTRQSLPTQFLESGSTIVITIGDDKFSFMSRRVATKNLIRMPKN